MKEASLTPTGIHIHHPSKQRHSSNPCWNAFCSHICLLSPSWQGFQCACPIGLKLNSDNRTCDSNSVQEPSIIIASYMDLFQVTHHQIGKDSIVHLPTRSLENVGALAFNPLGHSIIYSDLSRKMILSMHLETQRETVLFENTELVEGLDVDPYTENIYWTEVAQGTLIIGHQNHDGTRERIVLARDLHSPKGIALAPELGLMFVVEGRISHVISVRHMDGTSRHELVQVYGSVSAMAYDRKHLYFSDSQRGTIERVTVNGTERTTLRAHLGSPVAMDVSNDAVFWLTQYSSRVEWLYKQEPKTTRSFVVDTEQDPSTQYRILSVVDSFDYADEHVCLGHTGGCSDICAPTPNGAKCMCPPGKELAVDGHICHPISCPNTTSTSDFFKCQSSVCIPSKNRCDGFPDCPMGDDEVNCRNDSTTIEKSVCALHCSSNVAAVAALPRPSTAMVIMTVSISLTNPPAAHHINATRTKSTAPISALAFLVRFFATAKLIVLVDGTKQTAPRRRPLVYLINSIANTVGSVFHSVGSAIRIRIAMMVKTKRTAMVTQILHFRYVHLSTSAVHRKTTVYREEPFAMVSLTAIAEQIKNFVRRSTNLLRCPKKMM